MKTRTKAVIDWVTLAVFCGILLLATSYIPIFWDISNWLAGGDSEHTPVIFIGAVLAAFIFHLVFIKRQRYYLSYFWFIILLTALYVTFDLIKSPQDKMHLFMYFIVSFLFFKALHHHVFSQKLYFYGAIFSLIIGAVDETRQLFTANRIFDPKDLAADIAAAAIGQLAIALIVRPKLERWRFTLKDKRRQLQAQQDWLKKRKRLP